MTKDELSNLGLSWESNVRVVGEENDEGSSEGSGGILRQPGRDHPILRYVAATHKKKVLKRTGL